MVHPNLVYDAYDALDEASFFSAARYKSLYFPLFSHRDRNNESSFRRRFWWFAVSFSSRLFSLPLQSDGDASLR